MVVHKIKPVVVAETKLPFTQKVMRLYYNPKPLIAALKKKRLEDNGVHDSENQIFTQALYDYAVAALGKEEVERCLRMK